MKESVLAKTLLEKEGRRIALATVVKIKNSSRVEDTAALAQGQTHRARRGTERPGSDLPWMALDS